MESSIAGFRDKEIRKSLRNDEWRHSIVDVIEALTRRERPREDWNYLKKKLIEGGYVELSEKIGQLRDVPRT